MAESQSDKPNSVDIHVGQQLRRCRLERGVSQKELGEALKLSFQQIQKYERGTNRIGASRLWQIAIMFNAPVTDFFEGLAEKGDTISGIRPTSDSTMDLLNSTKRSDSEFISYYLSLPPDVRVRARQLLIAIYDAYGEND